MLFEFVKENKGKLIILLSLMTLLVGGYIYLFNIFPEHTTIIKLTTYEPQRLIVK